MARAECAVVSCFTMAGIMEETLTGERMLSCEFPDCDKRYSTEHSRRQHYRYVFFSASLAG